jgi:fatty-acyl-CoA synthase
MSPSAAIDHGPAPVPLLDETIGANLERTVARFGDRPALVSCHQGLRYSYAELDAEVDRVARALIAAGLVRGDRERLRRDGRRGALVVDRARARCVLRRPHLG